FSLDSDDKKVIMNCEARGNPVPTYSWLINGTIVDPGGDFRYSLIDGNLIIHNASEAIDYGRYQCRAENSIGSVLSRDALLQFAYLGAFSGRTRGAVSVREGQGVVLMCAPPPHSPEIIYSWVFNELPSFVAEDSRRFISQETGHLYISKVQPSDVGSYVCQVKNTVTNARVLIKIMLVNILKQPIISWDKMTYCNFKKLPYYLFNYFFLIYIFYVLSPVPTITWRKMSGNIPKKARLRKSQAVLEIPNIQLEDSGSYECKAENTRGGTAFRGHLQVYTLPQWISMINDTQLDSGEQLRWECRATGKPRPTYRWLRNGEPLNSQTDSGMYQCIAENKYGAIYSSAELKILASAPMFSTNPVRLIATVGKDVSLECRPRASPKPRISWRKSDRRVQPSRRIMLLRNNTLRIINSSRSDEGSYVCRAENQFGSAELTTMLLVKEPMRVELNPVRVEVTVGESVVLSCKVTHDPSLDVSFLWLLNNQPLNTQQEGGHFEYIQTVSGFTTDSSTADLMIRSILLKHAGKYGCHAQTSADSVLAEAELLVRGPPGPPGVVIVEEITDTTATLSWSHGVDNHSPITTYNVQARSPVSLGWQTVKTDPEPVTGNMESAMAVELNPWVEYEFRVVATNGIGTGDPSTPSRAVRTKEAVPSVAPANVRGGNGRRHELVISWEVGLHSACTMDSLLRLSCWEQVSFWKDMEQEEMGKKKRTTGNETTLLLTGLEGNTQYLISVKGFNSAGQGPASSPIKISTKKNAPSLPPGNLMWIQEGNNVSLSWDPVKARDNESEVIGYKVLLRQEGRGHSQVMRTPNSAVVLTLPEGGTYIIEVRAVSEGGEGAASAQVRVLTSSGKRWLGSHSLIVCINLLLVFIFLLIYIFLKVLII
uniref:Contactin-5 n=1 Tax=Cyprinus carpio TaxID=7962 RepID=A0A8C1TKS6_CYPCA